MLITIPDVLTVGEVAQARAALDAAEWVDGKVTAGYQAQSVKENLQLPEGHPVTVKLGEMVLAALARSPLFMSAALPRTTTRSRSLSAPIAPVVRFVTPARRRYSRKWSPTRTRSIATWRNSSRSAWARAQSFATAWTSRARQSCWYPSTGS